MLYIVKYAKKTLQVSEKGRNRNRYLKNFAIPFHLFFF